MIALLVAAVVVALVDWYSVWSSNVAVERLAKPAVLSLLFIAHIAGGGLDSGAWAWIAVGLALSLVGDVALLGSDKLFEVGLGAFLLAHIAYVIAFVAEGLDTAWLIVGLGLVVGVATTAGRRIVSSAYASHGLSLGIPVGAYMLAVGAMAVFGIGTESLLLAAGGVLFLLSDALLGWGKFVGPATGGRTLVHITYHLAQIAIVAGVAR